MEKDKKEKNLKKREKGEGEDTQQTPSRTLHVLCKIFPG